MPRTPGAEWAVAHFSIDHMYSNDSHRLITDPAQQYRQFYITLNGALEKDSFIELDWIVVWRGIDEARPSPPGNIRIESEPERRLVRWERSEDNLHVRFYDIQKKTPDGWQSVTISTGNWFAPEKKKLGAGIYAITAEDLAGNRSARSEQFTVGE